MYSGGSWTKLIINRVSFFVPGPRFSLLYVANNDPFGGAFFAFFHARKRERIRELEDEFAASGPC